jgi:hypothetical protein
MPSRSSMRRTRHGRSEPDFRSGSGCGLKLGGEGLKTCGIIVFPQENLTRLTEPNRAPMGSKAGPLCAAAARSDPGFCFRSIDCGTVPVPIPVPALALSLVFPADFAARSEQVSSETPAGRPVGGGGWGASKVLSEGADELNGALNWRFFPIVFTDCGHFFVTLRSASARIFDEVFSPGFW